MGNNFIDNKNLSRFERHVGAEIVFANYKLDNGVLSITYVEAPTVLRGGGDAGKLMQDVMEYARAQGLKVFPICGYAVSWIRRHEDYNDLLA